MVFQLEHSQSGQPDGEPFEASSYVDALEYILAGLGYVVKEVNDEEKATEPKTDS